MITKLVNTIVTPKEVGKIRNKNSDTVLSSDTANELSIFLRVAIKSYEVMINHPFLRRQCVDPNDPNPNGPLRRRNGAPPFDA